MAPIDPGVGMQRAQAEQALVRPRDRESAQIDLDHLLAAGPDAVDLLERQVGRGVEVDVQFGRRRVGRLPGKFERRPPADGRLAGEAQDVVGDCIPDVLRVVRAPVRWLDFERTDLDL